MGEFLSLTEQEPIVANVYGVLAHHSSQKLDRSFHWLDRVEYLCRILLGRDSTVIDCGILASDRLQRLVFTVCPHPSVPRPKFRYSFETLLQILIGLLFMLSLPQAFGLERYLPQRSDPFEEPWRFSEIEGLNDESIRCMDVSADGALWVGLIGSIARYDGESVRVFGEVDGLKDRTFYAVKAGRNGTAHALCQSELWFFDGERWSVIREDLQAQPETRIQEGPNGVLWFCSGSLLVGVEGERSWTLEPLAARAISDFCIDDEGCYWIVTEGDTTVFRLLLRGQGFEELGVWAMPDARRKGARKTRARERFEIAQTSDGRIWLIGESASFLPRYLEPGSDQWVEQNLERIGGSNRNYSICETSDGVVRIWGEEALHWYDGTGWRVYDNSHLKLTYNRGRLHESADGAVWVLENFVSIRRIDYGGKRWRSYRDLNFQCETPDGRQWFLERNGRVVCFDPSDQSWVSWDRSDGLVSDPIQLFVGSFGRVWASGADGGVAAVASLLGDVWDLKRYEELGSKVLSGAALQSRKGELHLVGDALPALRRGRRPMFATHSLEADTVEYRRFPHVGVSGIKELSDGRFVLSGGKLVLLDGDEFSLYDEGADALFAWSHDVEVGADDTLWVANWGDGVWHSKEGAWELFSKGNGLSSDYVSDLLTRADGTVVALTAEGVDRFDGSSWSPITLPGFAAVRDGSSLRESGDGALWVNVATRKWYFRGPFESEEKGAFKTLRYAASAGAPDTFVAIASEPDRYATSALLSWSGRDRWSETAASGLEYSYRLDDGEWSAFRKETSHFFQALNAGSHRIEVRARDEDGNVDGTPASVALTIVIPFWESAWFVALVCLTVLFIAALVYRLLLQRARHIQEIGQLRLRFVTHISHELRSPLTLIAGPLEKLVGLQGMPPAAASCVAMIQRNTKRLHNLVEELLEWRKLESGTMALRPQPVDIVAFTRSMVADFDNHARCHDQQVLLESSRDSLTLNLDPEAYRKILDNLILNALKFSEDGKSVRVFLNLSCATDEGRWNIQFIVEDEGSGIPKQSMPHIFDTYYSGKHSRGHAAASIGIGLSLVKALVELNGGSIEVQSPIRQEGAHREGTRFVINLPDVEEVAREESEEEEAENTIDFPLALPEGFEEGEVVLVVDDQSDVRKFLCEELGEIFHTVGAKSAAEGIRIARERMPDVILSDVIMPEMDGFEFCRSLRKIPELSHIPVILQTSLPTEENQKAGVDAGAIDFVPKPISISELKQRIRNQIDLRTRYADRVKAALLRPEADEMSGDREVEFIEKARALIGERYSDSQFTIDDFAASMGMSRSTFYRRFRAVANISPADYMKSYRLEKSTALLNKGWTVAETAYEVGYTEASPFNRAFKKHFGCSPSEYRKSKGA